MEHQYYEAQFGIEDSHWWYLGRRRVLSRLLRYYAPHPAARALEIGCGGGGNLAMLATVAAEVAAIEMEPSAVAVAQRRGVATVEQGRLDDPLPCLRRQYEVAAMFDVLEHIEHDVEALRAVRERLLPDGRLFLTVPAYPWLWTRHDEVAHHHRRYTRPSLGATLVSSGYEVLFMSYFNSFLFPPAMLTLLASRWLRLDPEAAIRQPPALVNRMLRAIFTLESRLLPALRLPFGLSIAAVATPVKDTAHPPSTAPDRYA